ncbi:MAG: ribosome small subunit-dependent GTPase A [Heliobacteriaceae bacterium]|jgi:ribosome biogenesis GTPase|nr:ribosome small subunit-dependent GTPase A [Heliobacteriaceae bacterium]
MKQGQVFKIHSDFYYVDDGVNIFECKIREVLKKQKEKIFTGDFVNFENGVIESIIPRKTFIPRPGVANIDQIIIVSALKEPDLNLNRLNRYIALAKYYKIPAKLCFNKSDLKWDKNLKEKILSIYKPLNFEIVFTSAAAHAGIEEFQKLLDGKTSVLCGNSGVGKSSLINAVNPDLNLRIGAVSAKTQNGTHTTRHCEIIKLDVQGSTRIADTPGFSNMKFDFLLPQEVGALFDEIAQYSCKYSNCLHISEDGCRVLANLAQIDESRYAGYLEFVEEARGYKEKIKYEGTKKESAKKISNNRTLAKISGKKRQSARNTLKQSLNKDIEV